jgi:preprotein translocase subunit SecF
MRWVRLVPDDTRFDFMARRRFAFAFTILLTLASLISLAVQGLNLGLDFTGGVLVEARHEYSIDLAALRPKLNALGLGEVQLQRFGDEREVMIRLQEQPGGAPAQVHAIDAIKAALGAGYEIRRSEFIGPQVSHELLRNGVLAAVLAVALISVYVWFRFEWQFGVAALLTTFHDVIATFGLFSLLRLDFDLIVVTAILTIAGYSINDTVVVFDRVRENLRKYKKLDMRAIVNMSVNQTLSRTMLTAGTTMVAVLALLFFGGPVLFNFAAAFAWGILIGTYSSVFVASALLLSFPSPRAGVVGDPETAAPATAQPAKLDAVKDTVPY